MQQLWLKYGKKIILPAIGIASVLLYLFLSETSAEQSLEIVPTASLEPSVEQTSPETEQIEMIPQTIVVDVKGAVKHPGVYTFTNDDRVIDAIEAAGGYVDDAETMLINHAQKLSDELIIYVPTIGEEVPEQISTEQLVVADEADTTLININNASEEQLTTLPGIGPAKARAIIAHREEKGLFNTIEGIKEVNGIGEKTFEQLQQLISVSD